LGFRQGVEPGEELGAFLGLFEALIQLVADVAGEAGYFAIACAHSFDGFVVVSIFQFFGMASLSHLSDYIIAYKFI
jgi:hypothetical protein